MSSTQRKRRQFNPERLATLAYFDAEATYRYAPIAPRTFYELIAAGKLKAFRVGGTGKLVVRREDLDRLLTVAPAESRIKKIVDEILAELGAKS